MNRFRLFAATFLVLAAWLALIVHWWYRPTANQMVRYSEQGNIAGVKYCLARGVHPDAPEMWGWSRPQSPGQTPLTAAASSGQAEVVRLLLRKGANVNLREFGPRFPAETPIAQAAMCGHLDVCKILLAAGADPNIPTTSGWTALDWALHYEQAAVAELLRQHGAVESGRRTVK